ncbi:hypothetical protein R7U64_03510 [Mesomycoplasma ovipneumoniae]|nr:hypothetical protein [Mesomycoplasma ovipneumoniae]
MFYESNKKLTLEEFLAQVQSEITKFLKVDQPFARDCFIEMYKGNRGIDINICVDEKRSENSDNEINKFAEQMNIDSKKLKNYINDNNTVDHNDRIERLVEGRLNEEVKENIIKIKNLANTDDNKKKIKKYIHYDVVSEFIKAQKDKLKQ